MKRAVVLVQVFWVYSSGRANRIVLPRTCRSSTRRSTATSWSSSCRTSSMPCSQSWWAWQFFLFQWKIFFIQDPVLLKIICVVLLYAGTEEFLLAKKGHVTFNQPSRILDFQHSINFRWKFILEDRVPALLVLVCYRFGRHSSSYFSPPLKNILLRVLLMFEMAGSLESGMDREQLESNTGPLSRQC